MRASVRKGLDLGAHATGVLRSATSPGALPTGMGIFAGSPKRARESRALPGFAEDRL
jgi:hypothetical protein